MWLMHVQKAPHRSCRCKDVPQHLSVERRRLHICRAAEPPEQPSVPEDPSTPEKPQVPSEAVQAGLNPQQAEKWPPPPDSPIQEESATCLEPDSPQAAQQRCSTWSPPPHKIYKGNAGSPTSFPVFPPGQKPGQEPEPDDDDFEWVRVGPNAQILNPEEGPLEKRVSTSFLEGMLTDKVNLQETDWWFKEPEGGWDQGDKWMRAAKRVRTNMRQNARNAGPNRAELHELEIGAIYKGVITALWFYEGIQVDIGAQWDGMVAIPHQSWDTIRFDLVVGQEVYVEVFRTIDLPRCKFPLQLVLIMPDNLDHLLMDPMEYAFPFDLEGLNTPEEKAAATGLEWNSDSDRAYVVSDEEALAAREAQSMEAAAKAGQEEQEQRAQEQFKSKSISQLSKTGFAKDEFASKAAQHPVAITALVSGLSTLSSRIASLAADFGDRLRPGIAEGQEDAAFGAEEEGAEEQEEEEIVEMTEEQLLQELDKQEPAFRVCSRLFRPSPPELPTFKRLKLEHIEHLQQHGFVKLDSFLPPETAVRLRADTVALKRQGRLQEPQRVAPGFSQDIDRFAERTARGDHIMWLHPRRPPATLYTFAFLTTVLQEVQEDLSQLMKLRQATPEFQLSVYPPGGSQYVRHRDAFPDDGSDEHQRKVTAIVYANPNWSASDGGKLRLWLPKTQPHRDSPSAPQSPPAPRGPSSSDISTAYVPTANGHANGHLNGFANGHVSGLANGHVNGNGNGLQTGGSEDLVSEAPSTPRVAGASTVGPIDHTSDQASSKSDPQFHSELGRRSGSIASSVNVEALDGLGAPPDGADGSEDGAAAASSRPQEAMRGREVRVHERTEVTGAAGIIDLDAI
ncbi:hypothetical protein WJX73_000359 [Symbiochloris irregularis]|uniref:Prolyl 4-hydroxylase alpha subunit Fe(2+) 2OG dioxygenase domain-containing protein n=1 Tax=Symbiochloris irregularis TaxID=706552 RepID=A0AAW1NMB7_9CHLO